MGDKQKWLPSDEEIATAINEYMKRLARKYMGGTLPGGVVDDLQDNPVVGLIDRAVEKALAEQEARHKREVIEAKISALMDFRVEIGNESGIDDDLALYLTYLRAELAALEGGKP